MRKRKQEIQQLRRRVTNTNIIKESDKIPIEDYKVEILTKKLNTETENKLTLNKITTNPMEEYTESNYHFLKLVIKWRVHFLIISIAAIIIASVFSSEFFIPSKYKSFAIIYPSNLTPYGHESPAEQMIQLLESADIQNTIIRKFDLAKRYDIDTTGKSGHAQLISTYESNVSISRTQFESVEIKVLDTAPKVACDIVTEMVNQLNLKTRVLQRSKTNEVLVLLTNELNYKKHQLDSINANLQELRVKYHILDYKSQTKAVLKSYVKELASGKGGNKSLDEMMHNLEEKGGEYYENIQMYDALLKGFAVTKLQYDEEWKEMNKELTYTNMVTYPSPSDKKAYPIRSLIILISVVSANLFLFSVLVILDSRKRIFNK